MALDLQSVVCVVVTVMLVLLQAKQGSSCDDFIDVSDCACPGSQVQYLCTVNDPSGISFTRWEGSAFDCTAAGRQASLFHNQYTSGAADTCNDGDFDLIARGLTNVTDNCYTSVLTVNIEPGLNGRTVECTTSNRTIGSTTVRVAVPLPAPSRPEIVKPNDGTRAFIVSWAPPTAECGNAVNYMYPGLAASMCGQCTGRSDTLSVTCREWTAQGQSCSITARADNCAGMGEQSQPVVITLLTPPAPVVEGTPVYDAAGVLRKVNLKWTPVVTPVDIAVSGGSVLVDGRVENYTVQSLTDDVTADIECNDTQCHSTVLLFNGTGPASLSVAAVNLLGTGDAMTVGPYERGVGSIESIDVSISGGRVAQLTVQCPPELNCASFEFGVCNSSVSFEAEMVTAGVFTASELNSTTIYCYRLYINTGVGGITEGTFATEIYPCSSVDLVPEGDSLQRSEDCTTPAEEGLAIFNGGICYPADLLPSSVATYQCDPGFCLDVPSMEQGRCVDSYNRTCQDNQLFSLQTATCIPMPTCPNTELIFSQISIEQRSAVYKCTSGFGISNPLLTYTAGVGWGEPPCCSDLSIGAVIGITFAIVVVVIGVLLVVVLIIIYFCCKHYKDKHEIEFNWTDYQVRGDEPGAYEHEKDSPGTDSPDGGNEPGACEHVKDFTLADSPDGGDEPGACEDLIVTDYPDGGDEPRACGTLPRNQKPEKDLSDLTVQCAHPNDNDYTDSSMMTRMNNKNLPAIQATHGIDGNTGRQNPIRPQTDLISNQ